MEDKGFAKDCQKVGEQMEKNGGTLQIEASIREKGGVSETIINNTRHWFPKSSCEWLSDELTEQGERPGYRETEKEGTFSSKLSKRIEPWEGEKER